nr:hypothetical protein [Tanacetum cinerariifolium]
MTSTVICLSKGQKFNFLKYIFDSLVRNVDSSSKFYMVGKGFSGVEIPLFEGMLAVRQPAEEGLVDEQVQVDDVVVAAVEENVAEDVAHDAIPSPLPHDIPSPSQKPSLPPQQPQCSPQAPPQGAEFPPQFQQVLNVCSALTKRVKNLENDNAAQKLVIIQLKARVKRLEKANMVKSSRLRRLRKVGASKQVESSDDMEDVFNQGRMIDDMEKDEGIELVKDAEVAESEGRHAAQQAKKQAEIYHIDLDHSSRVLSMQEDDSKVQEVVEVVTTAKLITEVVTAAASQVTETPKVKDKGKGILVETPKPMKKKYQIELDAEYARKLHEEINRDEFDENMRFLFKSSEEMEEEDQEIIKSINKTPAQKAAKRRKLSEEAQEAEDLRKRLEVVDDEDDDVFIEATPLARKMISLSRFTLEQLVNVTRLQVEEESEMSLELLRFQPDSGHPPPPKSSTPPLRSSLSPHSLHHQPPPPRHRRTPLPTWLSHSSPTSPPQPTSPLPRYHHHLHPRPHTTIPISSPSSPSDRGAFGLTAAPLGIKFATCTLLGNVLTWWNSHVKTIGHDAAYGMPWKALMKMMTTTYCPRSEIKKLEIKIWNLKVKGIDVLRSVMASNRKTMQDAIEFATALMDQKIRTFAERQAKNKRRLDKNSSDNNTQKPPFKRQNVARAYFARPSENKKYARTLPLCNKCKFHHNGLCNVKCANCNRVSHLTRDYRSLAATANNQRTFTCYECGKQGHYMSDCPKLKNQNHGNQAGGTETRGMVYALGLGKTDQDPNNIEDNIVA